MIPARLIQNPVVDDTGKITDPWVKHLNSMSTGSGTVGLTGPTGPVGPPGPAGADGAPGLDASQETDTCLPGAPLNLAISTIEGTFFASWDDPTTGNLTIDNCCIQYSTSSNFTTGTITTADWGKVNRKEGVAPNKTYYFRVALRNRSNVNSNVIVRAAVEGISGHAAAPYGWGPFCLGIGPTTSGYSVFKTADTGKRTIIDAAGIRVYDNSENLIFEVPIDTLLPFVKAVSIISSLGGLSLFGLADNVHLSTDVFTPGAQIFLEHTAKDILLQSESSTKLKVSSTGIEVTGLAQCDTFRIDQTPATETITPDKTITISCDGANYKIAVKAA
jgi:hypothetical protein